MYIFTQIYFCIPEIGFWVQNPQVWICVLVLWSKKDFLVVKNQIWNVCIKAFFKQTNNIRIGVSYTFIGW